MSTQNTTKEESVTPAANADSGDAISSVQPQATLARVLEVSVELTVELGRRRMRIADVLALSAGSTIEFSKAADEPLDIFVNDQLIARGEAVVVGDRYGVRITEVVTPSERLQTSGAFQEVSQ